MRKIKWAAAIAAVVAGSLVSPLAAGTAFASTYTKSYMTRCARTSTGLTGCATFQAYATNTNTQIWINGKVGCAQTGGLVFYWCGVGGGNGTAVLNIGADWNWPAARAKNLYERMNIDASGGCSTNGSNSGAGDIDEWWNAALVCKQAQ